MRKEVVSQSPWRHPVTVKGFDLYSHSSGEQKREEETMALHFERI